MEKHRNKVRFEVKRHLIMEYIAQGYKYMDIVRKCANDWQMSEKVVQNIINDTIKWMQSDETKNALIAMNLQRLDTLIADSMQDGDRRNAIKAIDTQNKLAGGYEEKVTVNTDNDIVFKFDIGE